MGGSEVVNDRMGLRLSTMDGSEVVNDGWV